MNLTYFCHMSSEILWFSMSIAFTAVSVLVIWLLTKFRKPRGLEIKFDKPWLEGALAVGYVVGLFLILATVFFFLTQSAGGPLGGTSTQFDLRRALSQWGVYATISIIPILVIVKRRKQSFETVGVTRKNMRLSLGLGLLLSVSIIALSTTPERLLSRGVSWNSLYALIYYLAVGLGEELMFRGFLQLRCSNWLGEIRGFILASTIMALVHIPQRIFAVGLDPLEALVSALSLMPVSFLLGFLMLRTRNIAGPAALHTVANWISVL